MFLYIFVKYLQFPSLSIFWNSARYYYTRRVSDLFLGCITLLLLRILPLWVVKHDPWKALSVIRLILPAAAPIWLTRKFHVSIRYLFHQSACLAIDSPNPSPPPSLPLTPCFGMAVNWGIISFWFCYSWYDHANFSTRYVLYLREKKRN